jgi:Tfp pilus assembly protein PilX
MRRLRSEEGIAMVVAMFVMVLMMMFGVATLAQVSTQSRQSGVQRIRESAFNLAEGVLYQQALILSTNWPAISTAAYPVQCVPGSTATTQCPDQNSLASTQGGPNAIFRGADYDSGATWVVKVRDNSGSAASSYEKAVVDGAQAGCTGTPCTYDANGDNRMWVRAEATVRGKTRVIVALLALEKFQSSFPRNAVTAGSLHVSNDSGILVDAQGSAAAPSQVVLRCTTNAAPSRSNPCAGYGPGQIQPNRVFQAPSTPAAMTSAELASFKAVAQANGTYYTSCPTFAQLTGKVVYIDPPSAVTCTYTPQNAAVNSPTTPGVLIQTRGQMSWDGKLIYYGILYMVNLSGISGSATPVFSTGGESGIVGALAVDGNGDTLTGSSTLNVKYDARAFAMLASTGTAGMIQNSWRELAPGQ